MCTPRALTLRQQYVSFPSCWLEVNRLAYRVGVAWAGMPTGFLAFLAGGGAIDPGWWCCRCQLLVSSSPRECCGCGCGCCCCCPCVALEAESAAAAAAAGGAPLCRGGEGLFLLTSSSFPTAAATAGDDEASTPLLLLGPAPFVRLRGCCCTLPLAASPSAMAAPLAAFLRAFLSFSKRSAASFAASLTRASSSCSPQGFTWNNEYVTS